MLKHLKKVRIEFNPFHAASRSALEFLSQCKARSAVDSNPSCELSVRRRTDQHPPFVQVGHCPHLFPPERSFKTENLPVIITLRA